MTGPGRPAGRDVAAQRARLLERDGPTCWLCRLPLDLEAVGMAPLAASLDHVVPFSQGGPHTDDNARLAHVTCNSSRGARTPTGIGPQSRAWL